MSPSHGYDTSAHGPNACNQISNCMEENGGAYRAVRGHATSSLGVKLDQGSLTYLMRYESSPSEGGRMQPGSGPGCLCLTSWKWSVHLEAILEHN